MSKSPEHEPTGRPSRREFLARSAALTGTAMAGSLAIDRGAHAAGSDVLKIGLIGCGGRGAGAVANALRADPNTRIVAMADAFGDRIEACRKSLKQAVGDRAAIDDDHCFADFDGHHRLIESGVDVVILAEPPHFRPVHIEACVDGGVHLMAEKPMAVDAPGVRRVMAAGEKAKQKGLSFVSGFESRYSNELRETVARVHDGAIGDIVALRSMYNVGPLWHRGRRPEWSEMQFQMRNWYYFTWLSGDHIVEQHVHFMDRASWIMQEQPPQSAWGYGGRAVRTEAKYGDIFDHHAVNFEYPDGVPMYTFTRQQAGCYNEVADLVLGTKGRLVTGRPSGRRSGLRIEGQVDWSPQKDLRHPEVNCFTEMFAGIRNGKPINDSHTMAQSTMVAILGRMATHSGQKIIWEDALNSNRVLAPKSYTWDADPPVLPRADGSYPHPIPGVTEVL